MGQVHSVIRGGDRLKLAVVLGVLVVLSIPPFLTSARAADPEDTASWRPVSREELHGITSISENRQGRVLRAVVETAALSKPVRINVILPVGYDRPGNQVRRYPTLYLFHGTVGGAEDWLELGGALAATRHSSMIVVSADAGYDSNGGGYFTNWVDQHTPLGAAQWERFHIRQMIPWVDERFRTDPRRSQRAIAGLSQGGFGATSYAARHPDMFVSVASFSGLIDIARGPASQVIAESLIVATMQGANGVPAHAPFGDPVTNRINWQGHNPADLVSNLGSTDVSLWVGNGTPGPLDSTDPANAEEVTGGMALEQLVQQTTKDFTAAADASDIDVDFHAYGAGTHTWPYWARDLTEYLPHLTTVFQQARPRPQKIDYQSVERSWSVWGWRISNVRTEDQAWSALRQADRDSFTFEGGPAVAITPKQYLPGRAYGVRCNGCAQRSDVVTADAHGRLRIEVEGDIDGVVDVFIQRVRH